MTRRRSLAALILCSLLLQPPVSSARQTPTPTPAAAPQATPTPQPSPTPDAVARIKEEGLRRSKVMETLAHLTEVIGPRLTNSPNLRRANEWTRERLAGWGLQNARLEPWGPFGRGWSLERFSAEVVAPQSFPLLAYPKAWSPGTNGPVTADVVAVEANNEAELEKYKGRLRGAIVLAGSLREPRISFEPRARRLSERELLELANAPDPTLVPRRPAQPPTAEQRAAQAFAARKFQFYHDEGAAVLVDASRAGDGGMLQFVHSATVPQPFDTPADKRLQSWDASAPRIVPQITVSNDHYNRMLRMLGAGERLRMTVNLEVKFHSDDLMGYNTVAEIPGTDLKDEVVMLGAHLDSWHTATGATDNAAGVAVMMEAVRLIKALGLQPRRTVRIALWSGEEQGLLGSKFYVKEHFGPVAAPTPAAATDATAEAAAAVAQKTGRTPKKREARERAAQTATPAPTPSPSPLAVPGAPGQVFKPEYERFSVYFNADSGTGAIRGIYLQGNEALRPIFRRWLLPFRELKIGSHDYSASTITAANAGGSDFLSFDAVGLPGLDFLQDDVEYEARTWHSNQDTLDRVVPDDLKQAAVIVAAFVYNAATADQKLPRKTLREVRPPL